MENAVTLKDRVNTGKRVKFSHYTQGELWYVCDDGFEFPVNIEDCGNATFLAEDKAILFMRYIRKQMDYWAKVREERGLSSV